MQTPSAGLALGNENESRFPAAWLVRARAAPLVTRCGVSELGYLPNQTAAPSFLALQLRTAKR
jgi:hypothetical protein